MTTDLEDLWFIEPNGKLGTIKNVLAGGEYFVVHNGRNYLIVHVSKLADLELMNDEQLNVYQSN